MIVLDYTGDLYWCPCGRLVRRVRDGARIRVRVVEAHPDPSGAYAPHEHGARP